MDKTTVQISKDTLDRLKSFRRHERETYEDVLNWIMGEIEDDSLSESEIQDIKISLDDIRLGRTKSIEQVAKEIGISLK